jgi:hypothetical protein
MPYLKNATITDSTNYFSKLCSLSFKNAKLLLIVDDFSNTFLYKEKEQQK